MDEECGGQSFWEDLSQCWRIRLRLGLWLNDLLHWCPKWLRW